MRHCPACGALTRAARPAAAPGATVGARLTAACALLTGQYRLTKREAARAVADRTGADRAVGTISATEQQVRTARAPVVAEARTAVQTAPVANVDETRGRQGRQRA